MPWNILAASDITAEILASEVSVIETIEGGDSILPAVLARVVAELQSRILAAGNQIGPAGTVPDQLRGAAVAMVRWEWFCALPQTSLQSDGRKAQYEKAEARFADVEAKKIKVEMPASPQNVAGPSMRVETVRRGLRSPGLDKLGGT